MWFGAGNVCVSCVADPLPKWHTSRICEGHEDFSSFKVVLRAIKFEEKPSCVKGARYLLIIHEVLVAMDFFSAGVQVETLEEESQRLAS